MRALTISQPYASLIADGKKWVENRMWETPYRGPLMIHAGKGMQYLERDELAEYPTGCVVAVAELVACVNVFSLGDRIRNGMPVAGLSLGDMQRVMDHEYTEGPVGWALKNVRKLAVPVEAKGMQGLWTPSDELYRDVMSELPLEAT